MRCAYCAPQPGNSEVPEGVMHGKHGHWAARSPRADAMASVAKNDVCSGSAYSNVRPPRKDVASGQGKSSATRVAKKL